MAWALYALFVLYGCTIPFNFAGGLEEAVAKFRQLPLSPWINPATGFRPSIADTVQNILLFVPFGAFGILAGRRTVTRVLVVTALGTSLSLVVETLQLFMANRVASVADVATNTFGAFAGAAAALLASGAAVRIFARLQRSGWTAVTEFQPLVVLAAVTIVAFLQPFDITLDVSTVAGKVRTFVAAPWQFTGLRDEGLTLLVSGLLSISIAAYLRAIGCARVAQTAFFITVVLCAGLESVQLLITSRMAALSDATVFIAGAATGAWAWRARTVLDRPAIRNVAIVGATTIAVVLAMLSPFELRSSYHSAGWLPMYGYYARTTFQTLSHVIELLVLYFPLGFCLAVGSLTGPWRWLAVVLSALIIAAPVEYLQGWIVGRFPDASDVAVGVSGAVIGAWMAGEALVPTGANGLRNGRNSADKTRL